MSETQTSAERTESSILAGIPGLDEFMENNSGNAAQEGANSATGSEQSQTTVDTSTGGAGNTQGTQGGEGATNTGEGQQQTAPANDNRVIQRRDGLVERASTTNPGTRDLVDPSTGRVVATGGIERSVFEQSQRNRRRAETAEQELTQVKEQLAAANEPVRIGTQLQLQPPEMVSAMQAMAEFKRNPEGFAQQLITDLRARGFQLAFLNEGITPQMDMQAIQRMIDSKLAPLVAPQQQQQDHQRAVTEANAAAERELNNFLSDIPHAQMHLDVIGSIIDKNPTWGLDRAWGKLLEWASANQLDVRQPFGPQIRARTGQQAPAASQPQHQGASNQTTAPLPNGRGNGQAAMRPATRVIDEHSTSRDIVREAMRESGFTLDDM